MIYKNATAASWPQRVVFEQLPERTIVRLADNVSTYKEDDSQQELYRYDEVVFDLPDDRAEETKESIEASFADWWDYGQQEQEDETVSLEERVAALEELYLLGMEG